ncbi:MAG: hypothetical protein JSV54_05435 [Chloroflexota bacterium]|nr:MAG: hypothetical protein JSV54_05435 [Chloroflexota bacterium]
MMQSDKLRGSVSRFLLLNALSRVQIANLLTKLASPSGASVSYVTDIWLPKDLRQSREVRIECEKGFLKAGESEALKAWWLVNRRGANTPNWDIASACMINGAKGLILVEAKAHDKGFSPKGKHKPATPNGQENHKRIGGAIQQANDGLNKVVPGWSLSRDTHYQLCNRFAWAWKLASLGIPTILIYLGFLNATEMSHQGQPFTNAADWECCIRSHAKGIVPEYAWERKLDIGGTPLWFLVRTLELSFDLP